MGRVGGNLEGELSCISSAYSKKPHVKTPGMVMSRGRTIKRGKREDEGENYEEKE